MRGPLGDGLLLCGAAVVAVCDVWARACARVVGGVRLAIARRHVSVVVIIRTREAFQVRERVNPSVDTNGRRGESAVVRCGWSNRGVLCRFVTNSARDRPAIVLPRHSSVSLRASQLASDGVFGLAGRHGPQVRLALVSLVSVVT